MAPRIDSLSNHRIGVGDPLRSIFVRGSGFVGVNGVQVGNQWAESFIVDGDSIITVTLPHLTPGTTNWVIVYTADGASSPCEGDAQLLTVDDITDVPVGAFRIDEIIPPTIKLGHREVYWLVGTGLAHVTLAVIGGTPCAVESYDDTRAMVHIPEQFDGGADGATVELCVSARGARDVNVAMVCHAPLPQHEEGWPVILAVEPNHLGGEGGRIVVHGVRLDWVHTVMVGTETCTIDAKTTETIDATVPSLAAYRGQTLAITVIDPSWVSPASSATVTVD